MSVDIKKVAIDAIHKIPMGHYSAKETSECLRNALIDLNGGSTKLNYKTFYRGSELFNLVQEIIPHIADEGLRNDNAFMELVDYRNIAKGDENEFFAEPDNILYVSTVASGVRGLRRQTTTDGDYVKIPMYTKGVRIYECINRIMSGSVDFNKFVDDVGNAFVRQRREDAYKALLGVTAETKGLNSTYVKTGSYSESTLLELIEHVEANTGKQAKILGTKLALSKVTSAVISEKAKESFNELGYYGVFNGTPMISMKQAHKAGTDDFLLDNTKLYVVASDEKIVKHVVAGEGILGEKAATDNNDLTQEYVYLEESGTGVICANKIGVYTISGS